MPKRSLPKDASLAQHLLLVALASALLAAVFWHVAEHGYDASVQPQLIAVVAVWAITFGYVFLLLFRRQRRLLTMAGDLAEREASFRAMVEAFDGYLYVCSDDFRVEYMNENMVRRCGREGIGEFCYEVLHERDSVCPWCVNDRVAAGETVRWELRSPKDNRWYHVTNVPLRHPDGRISKMGMIQDITDRKQAEMELQRTHRHLRRESEARNRALQTSTQELEAQEARRAALEEAAKGSEQRYRTLFDTTRDAIFVANADTGILLDVNDAAVELTGRPRSELIGMHQSELHPPEEKEKYRSLFKDHCIRKTLVTQETEIVRADGEIVPVSIASSTFRLGGQRLVQGAFRDIRESKRLEEQLIRSERLAAVGALASGIAHEFNNINVSILGFTELALSRSDLDDEVRGYVRRVRDAAMRAGAITRNLLSFGRRRGTHKAPSDLNAAVRDALELARADLDRERVSIFEQYGELPSVEMDAGQMTQVVLNLLINARHAMVDRAEKRLRVETRLEGDWAFVSVRDSGCGISPENRKSIFTPFFSTKVDDGESADKGVTGTGLGLAVSHRIVEDHGGRIDVESREGEGAEFTILLPMVAPAEEPPPDEDTDETAASPPEPLGDSDPARVWVLDDEEDTRMLLRLLFEREGYAVTATDNGEEAWNAMESGGIDVLMLDLQMPVLSGKALLRRIETLPEASRPLVLVVTGCSPAELKKEAYASLVSRVIAKPFELEEVKQAVRECLGARTHAF